MTSTHVALNNAVKLIESSINVLRETAGAREQAGHHDQACDADQSATFLEGAVLLIEAAILRSLPNG